MCDAADETDSVSAPANSDGLNARDAGRAMDEMDGDSERDAFTTKSLNLIGSKESRCGILPK